jgi:glycosyltransferase involved in cell wall biosynthesis
MINKISTTKKNTTRTNICFVNKFNWLGAAPMGTVSVMMCHALASTGTNVTLYISGDPDPNPQKTLQNKYGLAPLESLRLQVLPKSLFKRGSKFAFYLYIKASLHIIRNRDKREKTIVISRNTNFLPFLWILKKLAGASVYFESHSFHNRAKGERNWLGIVPNFHDIQPWFLEKLFLPHMNGLICLTKSQSRLYKAVMPSLPAVVLPLGSPKSTLNINQPLKTRDPRKLVYCGRFVSNIDVDTLLEALHLCKSIGVTLTWFGLSDAEKITLRTRAADYDVTNSVFAESWLTHQDLRNKLSTEFGIGLATYKKNYITAVLTSPTKIFDYYAAGLPVIGSKINTVSDVMEHGREGLLYTAGNKESLYQCINQIVSDHEKYAIMQKNALQSAEFYSWESRAKRFISFTEEC